MLMLMSMLMSMTMSISKTCRHNELCQQEQLFGLSFIYLDMLKSLCPKPINWSLHKKISPKICCYSREILIMEGKVCSTETLKHKSKGKIKFFFSFFPYTEKAGNTDEGAV